MEASVYLPDESRNFADMRVHSSHGSFILSHVEPNNAAISSEPALPHIRKDHPHRPQILDYGGTTSSIERLPSRLQRSKCSSTDLGQQLEDLTYEISSLTAEIQWQRESRQALLRFQGQMFRMFHTMEDALAQVTTTLQQCEERNFSLWGIAPSKSSERGMI
jgi:hypothetical protein